MANGMPEVKAAADRLTDSNDEEGVARFIEKYILKLNRRVTNVRRIESHFCSESWKESRSGFRSAAQDI